MEGTARMVDYLTPLPHHIREETLVGDRDVGTLMRDNLGDGAGVGPACLHFVPIAGVRGGLGQPLEGSVGGTQPVGAVRPVVATPGCQGERFQSKKITEKAYFTTA